MKTLMISLVLGTEGNSVFTRRHRHRKNKCCFHSSFLSFGKVSQASLSLPLSPLTNLVPCTAAQFLLWGAAAILATVQRLQCFHNNRLLSADMISVFVIMGPSQQGSDGAVEQSCDEIPQGSLPPLLCTSFSQTNPPKRLDYSTHSQLQEGRKGGHGQVGVDWSLMI